MNKYLFEAAQYMDEHGWVRAHYRLDGQVCLYGAIEIACAEIACAGKPSVRLFPAPDGWVPPRDVEMNQHLTASLAALRRYLIRHDHQFMTACGGSVTSYNDTIIRTKEEAVKILMEAAESEA